MQEEFMQESKKLEEVITKLEKEIQTEESRIGNIGRVYEKSDGIRAQLVYMAEKKLKDMKASKDKPYFARLDFKEENRKTEQLYIGKLSILDSHTQEPIVVDWRAPIANLYYEGRLGKASYQCLKEKIEGEIQLKRQYFIEEQKLIKYVDMDVVGNDALLQQAISEKADDRLKNIVATIQEEQNEIIRASMNTPLIVQGVAGSGKTTIALHRIAYLIYQYEKEFNPEDFMIIAPNTFFLNYISNILPDLGVENVKQYTFETFAYQVIGKKLKIADSNEKLVTIVNQEFDIINQGDIKTMIQEAKWKSSLEFKEQIDEYLKLVEENYLPKSDFKVQNFSIMAFSEIQDIFINIYRNYPFEQRIVELKKHMLSKLKQKSTYIIEQIKQERSRRIQKLEQEELTEQEEREERITIFEQYETILQSLEKVDKKLVEAHFKEKKLKDCIWYYQDFIERKIPVNTKVGKYLKENTISHLKKQEIAFEDLAPLMYLHYQVYGVKFKNTLRHVIIDEAQDYGEFQFSILRTILKSNSMTILGDIAQGVHYYRGIEDWNHFIKVAFPDSKVTYKTLNKTYRTTRQIMEKANQVIEKLSNKHGIIKGEPVIEGKNSIYMDQKEKENEIVEKIHERIQKHKKEGYHSIAIIGKDKKECEYIQKELKKYRKDVKLIQSKDSEYHAGICIVPSYLAKGLEFDVVIIFNANKGNYTDTDLDIKLLYVTITRAMSKLDIFCTGELTSLLE